MSTSIPNADGAPRHADSSTGAEAGLGAADHAETPHAAGNAMGRPLGWVALAVSALILAAIFAAVNDTSLAEILDPEPTRGQQALIEPQP